MFGHGKEGEKVTLGLARGGWGYSLIWAIKVCAASKGGSKFNLCLNRPQFAIRKRQIPSVWLSLVLKILPIYFTCIENTSPYCNKQIERKCSFFRQFAIYQSENLLNYISKQIRRKVTFFSASLRFIGIKNSENILVNKLGEKVNFFSASF